MGVQINGSEGNVIATKGTYSGNVTIGGTLTYEDVTNIDSVGLVTARNGIEIGARPGVAASISVDGNAIFSGITTIGGASKFGGNMQMTSGNPEFEFNNGGPRLRVPSANTLSIFTTGGFGSTSDERIRITSGGAVGISTDTPVTTSKLDVVDGIINVQANVTSNDARIQFTRKNTSASAWIGIPNWNSDALYIYGPTSSSNEAISVYETGQWNFFSGGNANARLTLDANGNFALGSGSDAGNTLRYLDVANFNTGGSAGAIVRLLTKKSDGSGTGGFDIVKYKSGTAGFLNYENIGTVGDITFSTSPAGGSPLECLRLFHNGYHKFNRIPMFISNAVSTLGTAGSLTTSPQSAKAQLTVAADNNSNFDSTNKNFVCPVNGYYNVAINFYMGDMANVRRIVVMGYTLGGANGVQSNYLEALDMTFEDHTNQNYSQPWYFTAGTTIAIGMGGQDGNIASQHLQLSVFLITAV